jgi:hypothetical protein
MSPRCRRCDAQRSARIVIASVSEAIHASCRVGKA